jgi:hypothetical protein
VFGGVSLLNSESPWPIVNFVQISLSTIEPKYHLTFKSLFFSGDHELWHLPGKV